MLICLSCYDAGLTWVCQAHNALLAELTTDNQERAILGRHSSAAMMAGSVSALVSFYAWNSLSYFNYQLVCVGMALLAGGCFEVSFHLLRKSSLGATVPDSPRLAVDVYVKSEYGATRQDRKPNVLSVAGTMVAVSLHGCWSSTVEFVEFAGSATRSRSCPPHSWAFMWPTNFRYSSSALWRVYMAAGGAERLFPVLRRGQLLSSWCSGCSSS